MRRDRLKEEWKANRRFFLIAEILFISFFAIDLFIRFGNSDMWHPAKGGERPMDFSYFNAVLKSTSFPPYDPWFAGGYINYYYYGFVLVGTPLKLLGIVPSIAYNFILPTLFALVASGAFTLGWNLMDDRRRTVDGQWSTVDSRLIAGLAAAVMVVLIGNLGTIRFLFQTFQRMAAPGGIITDANFVQRWVWAIKGLIMSFGATVLPIGRGDWYWFPSRVIPAPGDVEPINEFPLFTFLYSDLHAHMIVLPITLFILAWTLSFLKSRAHMKPGEWIATFIVGALMVGALRPTNTWDLYTYFPLTALAVVYTIFRHLKWGNRFGLPDWIGRLFIAFSAVALLYILGSLFYAPYTHWYSQGYSSVALWTGTHTPIWSYLTHWGLFLFIIAAWLTWETREWMASTPVSALNKLRPYQLLIEFALAIFLALLVYFVFEGISAGWLALPLAAWAGILLLRPGMPGVKRAVLMMIGTALTLTIAVEVVVLVGDIGRMNTVFKLYLQGWTLFAVSAAAAFGWLLNAFPQWNTTWRNTYQIGVTALLTGTFLFTITATSDKIVDRMAPDAPRTLDSMTFMKYARHWDGQDMELSEDYNAIRWMQDNVQGSPVIVEANCTEYRWCTRFTIYTGLPGVVGWNFHQRQQRALVPPNLITDRVVEIGLFYTTMDIDSALMFLKKYQVKYIVVGQLERNIYPPIEGLDGLAKFEQYNGTYWRSAYHDAHTVIYEVLP
jgi:YYY domain-containing protein